MEGITSNIISIKTQITQTGGQISIGFNDGSGAVLNGSGLIGKITSTETIRGKRGNYARAWLDYYFSERSPSDTNAFITLLNEVVYPFIERIYEN